SAPVPTLISWYFKPDSMDWTGTSLLSKALVTSSGFKVANLASVLPPSPQPVRKRRDRPIISAPNILVISHSLVVNESINGECLQSLSFIGCWRAASSTARLPHDRLSRNHLIPLLKGIDIMPVFYSCLLHLALSSISGVETVAVRGAEPAKAIKDL